MTEDELRERAIEYLRSTMEEPKKVYEFTGKELCKILNKDYHNIYLYMEKLVENGTWGTRLAYSPSAGRNIRVWWLIVGE